MCNCTYVDIRRFIFVRKKVYIVIFELQKFSLSLSLRLSLPFFDLNRKITLDCFMRRRERALRSNTTTTTTMTTTTTTTIP